MTADRRRPPGAGCRAPQRRRRRPGSIDASRRDSRGLATLEWLLVIAAAGGFAAAMTAGLDRLIADHTDLVGDDPSAAHIEAHIAAARLDDAARAALIEHSTAAAAADTAAAEAAQTRLDALGSACSALPFAYPATVRAAAWTWLGVPAYDTHEVPAPATAAADEQEAGGRDGTPSETEDETGRTAAEGRWACRLSGPDQ